ncbi:MAG: DUF1127 domain-containing protein, partial [Gammaproteobacteria bacterium]
MNDMNVVKIGARLSLWRRLVVALRARHQRKVTIRELSVLSDRQLHDIGIARSEIPLIAEGLVSRQRAFSATQERAIK